MHERQLGRSRASPFRSALAAGVLSLIAVSARAELAAVDLRARTDAQRYQRRLLEVAVRGGGARAECQGDCGAFNPWGFGLGFSLSFRTAPNFAVGVLLERAWFRLEPEDRAATTEDVNFMAFSARAYAFGAGRLDPWAEIALVPGSYGSAAADSGFGLGAGVGLDVFLSSWLKLGPYARFDYAMPTHPDSGSSMAVSGDEQPDGPVSGMFQLGLAVTFTFGPAVE